MHRRAPLLLTVYLLLLSGIAAQVMPESVTVAVECAWDGYFDTAVDGLHPMVDGMACAVAAGQPALPSASRLLTVARGSSLTLAGWSCNGDITMVLDDPIAPAHGPTWKDDDLGVSVKPYAANCIYGDSVAHLQHLGIMGDHEVYRLTVEPFVYNPTAGLLTCRRHVSVELRVQQAAELPQPTTQGMLIVSRPQFRQPLQPFVQWKRQEGYEVSELYVDTHLRDSVKNLMRPYFAQPGIAPPRYVLLVGDAEQLQAFVGYSRPEGIGPHPTDLYYADFTDDYLPEALVGRWPVNDTAELRAVVEKTLRYEQYLGMDDAATSRVLLVAGRESSNPAPITTNGQVSYVSRTVGATHPDVDTVCFRNPASGEARADIIAHISAGTALVNYTAHCTDAGWSVPNVTYSSIDTLDEPQPAFYINNCCRNNDFSGTGFGEELLRKPRGGAAAVIGATNSTLWNEDYYWAVGPKHPFSLEPDYDSLRPGAFDRWLRDGEAVTAGGILAAGNLAVSAFGSPYDRFYWEIYCLLGDPTLRPHIGVPRQAAVAATGAFNGSTVLLVSATPGATVTAVQDSLLLAVAVADTAGQATLRLRQALDATPLLITASGAGLIPAAISPIVDTGLTSGITLRHVRTDDSSVSCTVENTGLTLLTDIVVTLEQDSLDTQRGATVTTMPLTLDSLRSGDIRAVTLPVAVARLGVLPLWSARLTARADSVECGIGVQHAVAADYPTATLDMRSTDDGWLLTAALTGLYDSARITLTAHPSGITLTDTVFKQSECSYYSEYSEYPDTPHLLHLLASLTLGNHVTTYDYWFLSDSCTEGFAQGKEALPWTDGGTQPWVVDSGTTHSGIKSLRSGTIGERQTSDLLLELLLPHADSISFWTKASTEPQYDMLLFSIDGVKLMETWGSTQWRRWSFPLEAGQHSLRWRYVKDDSGSEGLDCVWLDDVRLPLAFWSTAIGCGRDEGPGAGLVKQPLPRVSVRPNPASGTATVDCPDGTTAITLTDIYGRHAASWNTTGRSTTLDLAHLPSGIYILRLATPSGDQHTKLAIQH